MESLLTVNVNAPVLLFTLIYELPATANDLTPLFVIVIELAPLVILMPLPCVSVDSAYPLDEPISN